MSNLRKIIKEEIDDFDWIRDTEPNKTFKGLIWLMDNFNDLKKVIKNTKIYYVDSERKPLFMYHQGSENGYVYINYQRIWSVLFEDFGFNYSEIQELIKEWLEETYNLRGFTPRINIIIHSFLLEETYNLRGFTPKIPTPSLNTQLEETFTPEINKK